MAHAVRHGGRWTVRYGPRAGRPVCVPWWSKRGRLPCDRTWAPGFWKLPAGPVRAVVARSWRRGGAPSAVGTWSSTEVTFPCPGARVSPLGSTVLVPATSAGLAHPPGLRQKSASAGLKVRERRPEVHGGQGEGGHPRRWSRGLAGAGSRGPVGFRRRNLARDVGGGTDGVPVRWTGGGTECDGVVRPTGVGRVGADGPRSPRGRPQTASLACQRAAMHASSTGGVSEGLRATPRDVPGGYGPLSGPVLDESELHSCTKDEKTAQNAKKHSQMAIFCVLAQNFKFRFFHDLPQGRMVRKGTL